MRPGPQRAMGHGELLVPLRQAGSIRPHEPHFVDGFAFFHSAKIGGVRNVVAEIEVCVRNRQQERANDVANVGSNERLANVLGNSQLSGEDRQKAEEKAILAA